MARTPLIAANWKMHKTVAEATAFLEALEGERRPEGTELAVCPPYTALHAVVERARPAGIAVFAQNMHQAREGAFTGEVSATMLADAGADGVVLGHSERRQLFGETDAALAEKVPAALEAGLAPMLCVGETRAEREGGQTEARLRAQVEQDLAGVDAGRLAELAIAYEPVWAIGTGLVASPEQAQEAIAFIRGLLAERAPAAAGQVRILYGGSVKPDNAGDLLALPDVDGALVGGASLDPASFAAIARG